MADWMAAQDVTHVAMESTGVYWKPIYNILESRFTVLLVNARHLKHVPDPVTQGFARRDPQRLSVDDLAWMHRYVEEHYPHVLSKVLQHPLFSTALGGNSSASICSDWSAATVTSVWNWAKPVAVTVNLYWPGARPFST